MRGYPARVDCHQNARDPEMAARLWTLAEKLTNLHYL